MVALLLLAGSVVSCTDDGAGEGGQFTSFLATPYAIELLCGESEQIAVTTEPEYTFVDGELVFSVLTAEPVNCVSVDQTGLVTATDKLEGGNGYAIIQVSTSDGNNIRYVEVKVYESNNIKINSDDLVISTLSTLSQLYADVAGFAEDVTVQWSSSNESVVTIAAATENDRYGLVEVLAAGTTTITACVVDSQGVESDYSDQITIKVCNITISLTNTDVPTNMIYGDSELGIYQLLAETKVGGVVDDTVPVSWTITDADGNADTTHSTIDQYGRLTAGTVSGSIIVTATVDGYTDGAPSVSSSLIEISVPTKSVSIISDEVLRLIYADADLGTYQFAAETTIDGVVDDTTDVAWSITSEDGGSDTTGSSISNSGVLTVGSTSGSLVVVATIYAYDGSVVTDTTDAIEIYVPITNINFVEENPIVYTFTNQYSYAFDYTLSPEGANQYASAVVVWSLEDYEGVDASSIATIDQSGVVSAVAGVESGVVTVVATIYDIDGVDVEVTNSTTLTFTDNAVSVVEKVEIDNGETLDLSVNSVVELTATITPDDAINRLLHWTLESGDGVVTLDGSTIKAIGEGTAVVRVTPDDTYNPGLYDEITINVTFDGMTTPDLGSDDSGFFN